MADFDTANKRYSGIGLGLDWMRVRPVPDGSIDTPDRLHFLPLYSGVAASVPGPGGDDDVKRRMYPGHAKWRQFRLMYKQGA